MLRAARTTRRKAARMPSADPHLPRLVADIGGTNARFGWQAAVGAAITDVATLPCADHATPADALAAYLDGLGRAAPPLCAIAIATPVTGDQVRMTNHGWAFSIAALQARFGFARLRVLNDFTALALALPTLADDERLQVGGGAPVADAAVALIGPGTGLGVSGLVPDGRGGFVPLQGEGGHATLAGRSPREQQVLDALAARHGHASAERAVSGPGLAELHAVLQALDAPGQPAAPLTPAEVLRHALATGDAADDPAGPRCREALDLFCAFLGSAAGNLALTLGARGGVFIGGGIVPRLGAAFARSPFRDRFEAKGRFRGYLAAIPVWVITAAQSPALRGAARALDGG